ncbi:MAG: hypothetical protein PHS96_05840 [Anaerolineales bacterium]|nr:hypothetical protein [Anaerolineales bacterium]
MQDVYAALLGAGWQEANFARDQVLDEPIASPEEVGRVYVVARR